MLRGRGSPATRLQALLLCGLAGCSYHVVRRDAFGPKKTYAVVSIHAYPEIHPIGQSQGSLSGLVKMAGKDSGLSRDSSGILEDSVPIVMKILKGSGSFKLASEESVLGSKAYAAAAPDDPKIIFSSKFRAAKGYKFLSMKDGQNLAQLAQKLKVDGVILLSLDYGYTFSGVNAAGLIAAGTQHGGVRAVVSTYDRSGQLVWRDIIYKKSDASIGAFGETGNFRKLHPLLLEAVSGCAKELVAALSRDVRGP